MKKKYLLAIPAVAGLYAFLIAPRMTKKPDVSVLRGVHYAHRSLLREAKKLQEEKMPNAHVGVFCFETL